VICYADSSALVKRYVQEQHAHATAAWMNAAQSLATCIVSRAEVIAALELVS